jgi:hypothetical protein
MQKTYFKTPVLAVGVSVHGLVGEIEYEVTESVRWESVRLVPLETAELNHQFCY